MAEPMNMYEFPYIVDGVLSEEKIKEVVQTVTKYITENGGEILQMDEWGTRRLAFPIQKKNNGHYVITYFNAPGSLISKLERVMQINDHILRYMTLRYDAKMKRHYDKKVSEKKVSEAPPPETPAEAEVTEVVTEEVAEVATESEATS